ncbi:Eco57I restriction-modification methylase domain-containing protein [Limosilactobacillus reuteri]|uniref:Eco57I restriction-modification methylase domain-containing protein n=2 Tax=Limosilactobacillus reuteri TaxID=1598 RepID=A0AAW6JH45_LIMRT|nr:Eco57I restriction-modification methylase domain-containing protein [Limosilactobacillus reuteri]MDD1383199.1 Eco57I restriction-modification methylase domain-containing protein [Limosilactobacillus reuteri]MDD1399204.1 Eco57I restriction-modification methylase domain-containing protein [Limosilactobacillus reuteri]MDD1404638.1 Eco57I restriction-modification methylase domain-containing protein [Limosilactobacillus reuteri]MQB75687.1 restriction endonuclease [Limosilactobacillus reuteri]
MTSNFAFLEKEFETRDLYDTAKDAEDLYAIGKFANEYESIRKIAENVARMILDLNYVSLNERSTFSDCLREIKYRHLVPQNILAIFYQLKSIGNSAAHSLHKYTKSEGLKGLQQIYTLLVWFSKTYTDEKLAFNGFVEPQNNSLYKTTDSRKVIYVQTADNKDGNWPAYIGLEKIGDATIDDLETDNTPNSNDLRKVAENRINQYMKTAGVPHKLQWAELAYRKSDHTWFRDYDVHDVLERSHVKKTEITEGNEWYQTDVETAKKAIKAVKEGKKSLDDLNNEGSQIKIILRPEQREAVKKTENTFKKHNKMLWNAKMRFGKTLSALQLVKNEKYQHVLIMTHRPVVDEGWFEDFNKIGMPSVGYLYGSKKAGEDFDYLAKNDRPFVYFASLQDLRGSKVVGGSAGDKNEAIFKTKWDLVIIDEAHEGTQTELAKNVTDLVVGKNTKLLELSGTPFNILDQYDEDQVYTWDYVSEQRAKYTWDKEHPNEKNPYQGLPKVNMFTFEMGNKFSDMRFIGDDKKSFNFKEFFKVNESGEFVYRNQVEQFLHNITTPDDKTNYPYSTMEFRNRLRHTLWIMPGVKEANALEKMLNNHPVFGMEYKIINVVKNGDNEGIASESDVSRVNDAIGDDPSKTKTITLTVRKLTTGVTIKPWTGVLFLSNTNSAMQYLQAAFRAQTPYSSEAFGEKTNCYIFDFAPDRALTVMAASTQLNTGVGKRTSFAQKNQMAELMNFLPIIGETGNGMKPFKVDTMLAKIKRVYAEKAVRTGFDDDSLYSDELLMLKDADLSAFNKLKAIVGTTKAEKKPLKVEINNQGLTDEEYNDALKGEQRRKKERTPEQQAAIDKMKQLKKQRKTMISILRSISIRIPMMIYGMDVELDEDVNINKFIDKVDDQSWKEFMPKGVTKELFKEFSKYYDQDVFIEAGKIIRNRVKALDDSDPIERTRQLAMIFGTFRNPDKETVLTPWRVVNMHLGKTIGGYSFYDNNYKNTTIDGVDAAHWIHNDYTEKIFNRNAHVLEINSKTGLYPLYVATSRYYQEYEKQRQATAGNVSLENKRMIWQQILRENIFCVAKTPMAKAIAKRTLIGYQDYDVNIEFINDIVEDAKQDVEKKANKIKEVFGNLKFDVVIGNPPYQDETHGDQDNYSAPVYNEFMDLSYKLSNLVTLITPGRFLFGAGSTPKAWTTKMLNNNHFCVVKYEQVSSRIFPKTDIKGGIVISLYDTQKDFGSIADNFSPAGIFIAYRPLINIMKKVTARNFRSFSDLIYGRNIYRFTDDMHHDHPNIINKLSKGHAYDLSSNVFKRVPELFLSKKPNDNKDKYLGILGRDNNQRVIKYIDKRYIKNVENLDKYKVFVPKANGTGALGEVLSTPLIGEPLIGSTETFISIGAFNTKEEAKNTMSYIRTKFARTMLGILKITQDNTAKTWKLVPMQDFTANSDIDWTKSISEIDQQLYRKYNLSQDEIDFIETKVQVME